MNPEPASLAQRVAAIQALLEIVAANATPPLVSPSPPAMASHPAQLALDTAHSATEIAQAVAALGQAGRADQLLADVIWNETLAQIGRVQKLHHLPPLPFQQEIGRPSPTGA